MAIAEEQQVDVGAQPAHVSGQLPLGEMQALGAMREVGVEMLSTISLRRGAFGLREMLAEDDASIAGLAKSIASSGIIEPIVVRPVEPDAFEVVAGERRLVAAKLLKLTHVPCIIRGCTDREALLLTLTENLQRKDLSAIAMARGLRMLLEQFQLTQAEIGKQIGLPQSVIAHYLRLLILPEQVQSLIHDGRLSMGHGKVLAGVADRKLALEFAQDCVANHRTVRDLEASMAARSSRSELPQSARKARLELALPNGVFVVIKQSRAQPDSGTIEIPFWSESEKEWAIAILSAGGRA